MNKCRGVEPLFSSTYLRKANDSSNCGETDNVVCTGVFSNLRALLDFCVSSQYIKQDLSNVKVIQNWINPIKNIFCTDNYIIEVTETVVYSGNPYEQEFFSNDQVRKIFG